MLTCHRNKTFLRSSYVCVCANKTFVNICGYIQVCGLTSSSISVGATSLRGHLMGLRKSCRSHRLTTTSMTIPHITRDLIIGQLVLPSIARRICLHSGLVNDIVSTGRTWRRRGPTTTTCRWRPRLSSPSLLCGRTSPGWGKSLTLLPTLLPSIWTRFMCDRMGTLTFLFLYCSINPRVNPFPVLSSPDLTPPSVTTVCVNPLPIYLLSSSVRV